MFLVLRLCGSGIVAVGLCVTECYVAESVSGADSRGLAEEYSTVDLTGCDSEICGKGGYVLSVDVVMEGDLSTVKLHTDGNVERTGVVIVVGYVYGFKRVALIILKSNYTAFGSTYVEYLLHSVLAPEVACGTAASVVGINNVNLECGVGVNVESEVEDTYGAGLEVLEVGSSGYVSGKPYPRLTVALRLSSKSVVELSVGIIKYIGSILGYGNNAAKAVVSILNQRLVKYVGYLTELTLEGDNTLADGVYGLVRNHIAEDLITCGAVRTLSTCSLYNSVCGRAVSIATAFTDGLLITGCLSSGMTERLAVILATGCAEVTVLTVGSGSLGVSECGNDVGDGDVSALLTYGSGISVGGTGRRSHNSCALVTALVEYPSTVSGVAECEVVEHNTAVLSRGVTADVDAVNGVGLSGKLGAEGKNVLAVSIAVVGDLVGDGIKNDTDNDVYPAGEVVAADSNLGDNVIVNIRTGRGIYGVDGEGNLAVRYRADSNTACDRSSLPSVVTGVGSTVNKLDIEALGHVSIHLEGENANSLVVSGEAKVCAVVSNGNPKLKLRSVGTAV